MTYTGRVKDGTIVLDNPVELPEGALVVIEVASNTHSATDKPHGSPLSERYGTLIGALDGMPEDWAENHDAYLRKEHNR